MQKEEAEILNKINIIKNEVNKIKKLNFDDMKNDEIYFCINKILEHKHSIAAEYGEKIIECSDEVYAEYRKLSDITYKIIEELQNKINQ